MQQKQRPTRDRPTETQERQREANRDTRETCNRGRERPTETQGERPKLRDTAETERRVACKECQKTTTKCQI